MDIHVLWAIIAVVIAVVAIGILAVAAWQRKNAAKDDTAQTVLAEKAETAEQIESEQSEPEIEQPKSETAEPTADEPVASASLDTPEDSSTRMQRLRSRLAKSANPFGKALFNILTRDNLSEADWEEVEDTLLLADVGTDTSMDIVEELRRNARVVDANDANAIRSLLRTQLLHAVNTDKNGNAYNRDLELMKSAQTVEPHVLMMVGVNGSGKTTTTGKLARLLIGEGYEKIVLGAADTFRAAAADQLQTWGDRVGVKVVRSDKEGADPASVAFEAAEVAQNDSAQVLIVDTAGRLQNKANLMDELGKIRRVVEKRVPVGEVLLVLDATTGQNGMTQAKVFAEAIGITGIVLTKLDGSAKGGIVISVQRELGVPVKFVGLGEGPDDLSRFDAEGFVDGILGA
ncbi:signal recognition particle-docking protein FtsY [Alloscardovia omnicolens]|uniref:Signal recognition particle receptor FtsY n=1 Tax=Alloscardovia omnicolens TaxID=419015 RepID=A0A2I1M483_9BIFI|nr:signal recognition particle-docking protein FtsY [Alloscardovia omnicolens]MDU6532412.1 signal recognition particle-docking protein FtsY [Alloscardovia omnicolens]PKZ14919.1 signal recognition particle-docking protein FtsY [Alloscardovia omnicolens]